MVEGFDTGDEVEIEYRSDRSGSVVSRSGTVLQTPEDEGKRGFFAQTDDDQLTAVMAGRVYSVSVGDEEGERTVQRKTFLGELEGVSSA